MSHKKYIEEIIEHAGMSSYKPSVTSVVTQTKLTGFSDNQYHDPT